MPTSGEWVGLPPYFPAIFRKGNESSFFAALDNKILTKGGSTLKGKN